ncbi:AAA-like domain-containing protein [Nostoc sp. 106C]|uniref:AAA-like domain-containing protein n=1 Tax=Nostoc sp. 106C TaxID=1932667 RepID=UPI000A36C2E9|nr:AAA-like domain-containing protein [Nostoc sp. 106C]OUL30738.1 hypothetical protein BV375_13605 [Nostoc sp. 106C]
MIKIEANFAYRYQAGGGSLAFGHPTYVQRQADTDLYDALDDGEYCYVLNARQMGKSSLRVQAKHRLQNENIACISIDLQGIEKNITQERWYYSIAYELIKKIDEIIDFDLKSWWNKHDNLSYTQRLIKLIESQLLVRISKRIVIFIDEIDKIISLDFIKDDFLSFIRFCYNQRTEKTDYKRLTFVLLGAATPLELIQDTFRMPFNIGRLIELQPFKLEEALKLAEGLEGKVSDPRAVLTEIWSWTGGQPFLTQKLCQLVLDSKSTIQEGHEKNSVESLVRSRVIKNWKDQDELRHLETISSRLLQSKSSVKILELYKQILKQGQVAAEDSPEQMELRISGLVVKQNGNLKVCNHIYQSIFNETWVRESLSNLRPYAEQLRAWLKSTSTRLDQSKLLYGQKYRDADTWKEGRNLTIEDYDFLYASRRFDERAREYLSNVSNYEAVIEVVLSWTGGQEEISDTIFRLLKSSRPPREGFEAEWVDNLVRSQLIDNWEAQEAAKPLREICDRLKNNQECDRFRLLESYQQILQPDGVAEDGSREQQELLKLRLVVNEQGLLKVSNRIYKEVFNRDWVRRTFTDSLVSSTVKDKVGIFEVLQEWLPQLEEKTKSPYSIVIEEILLWTKPNPLLIKALCKLICESHILAKNEVEQIGQVVQTHLIDNWEVEEAAKPLRDIRDRLLENHEHDSFWLLIVYQQILRQEEVAEDCSQEKEELLRLKLVENINGKLSIANRTYQLVFNQSWVDELLARSSRPYAQELIAWLDSKRKDRSKLLVGEKLQEATAWADDNKHLLKKQEKHFLLYNVIENF